MPDSDSDHDQAAEGALILHRLVPAPDHGRGFRRDPETGFVYYSSEWLSDERETSLRPRPGETAEDVIERVTNAVKDAKPSA